MNSVERSAAAAVETGLFPADRLLLPVPAAPVPAPVPAPLISSLPAPAPNRTPPTLTRRVLQGPVGLGQVNRTSDVRAAQQALRAWGFNVIVDGRYGPQTRAALRRFVALVSREPQSRPSDRIRPGSDLARLLFAGPDVPRAGPTLSAAVGVGGRNRPADVRAVQRRLVDLGFSVGRAGVDGVFGPATERAIRTFIGAAIGATRADQSLAVLQAEGALVRLLFSDAAPRWQEMPTRGTGFRSFDHDGYGWGTTGAAAVLARAGVRYARNAHATSLIGFNDVSRVDGRSRVVNGRTEHVTHRFGTDIDVRLPRTDGGHGTWLTHSLYDREAAYSLLRAFAADPAVERILFADRSLFARAEARDEPWAYKLMFDSQHTTHMHVDVRGALAL